MKKTIEVGGIYTQKELAMACGISRQLLNRHIQMLSRGEFVRAVYNTDERLNKRKVWDGVIRGKLFYRGKAVTAEVLKFNQLEDRPLRMLKVTSVKNL